MQGITGKEFLVNDLSIVCWEGDHASMVGVGIAFMCLYIAGIPLIVFLTLFRNRAALWDESHKDHKDVVFEYGGLYM